MSGAALNLVAELQSICGSQDVYGHPHQLKTYESNGLLQYAKIARSPVWRCVRHGAELDDGRRVTPGLVREVEGEQLERIRKEDADDDWFYADGRPDESRGMFEQVALADRFVEFLTLPAYDFLLENVERL